MSKIILNIEYEIGIINKNMEEIEYIFVKSNRGTWFYIPSDYEPLFNQLLGESILSESSAKFIREFKEFKINCSPTEYRKQLKK